ncbi:MAG: alpha/beta hydrolase [Blastomonas sp.]
MILPVLALALLLGGGLYYWKTTPPGMLSDYDALWGGGSGAQRVASGLAFGSHGQRLDIWRPEAASGEADAKAERLPVLIFWYGGGWAHGAREDYAFAARAFARAGYLVIMPDYRKVPDNVFPDFLIDAAEAVRWTQDHAGEYGGDTDRMAVAGHSAGAHLALMVTLDRHWLADAGADSDTIKAVVGLSGPYDFLPFTSDRAVAAFGHLDDPLLSQPIHFARADAPPMLLVTSTKDTTVRPRNAINLAARQNALGTSARLINYDGLDHEETVMALSKPFRGKAPVLRDSLAFLSETIGTVPVP